MWEAARNGISTYLQKQWNHSRGLQSLLRDPHTQPVAPWHPVTPASLFLEHITHVPMSEVFILFFLSLGMLFPLNKCITGFLNSYRSLLKWYLLSDTVLITLFKILNSACTPFPSSLIYFFDIVHITIWYTTYLNSLFIVNFLPFSRLQVPWGKGFYLLYSLERNHQCKERHLLHIRQQIFV